ncbi:MAG: hypothetical protein LBI31_04960, partial [Zoogloeaceae bacterium]|nr:hypothetical protein [Zoogloeaceae bacterium]
MSQLCNQCRQLPGEIGVRELARRAAVAPIVASRAIRQGVYPKRNPEAAERLRNALEAMRRESGACAHASLEASRHDHFYGVETPVCKKVAPAEVVGGRG